MDHPPVLPAGKLATNDAAGGTDYFSGSAVDIACWRTPVPSPPPWICGHACAPAVRRQRAKRSLRHHSRVSDIPVFGRNKVPVRWLARPQTQEMEWKRLDAGEAADDTWVASRRYRTMPAQRGKPTGLSRFYILASSFLRRFSRRGASDLSSVAGPRMHSTSRIILTWVGLSCRTFSLRSFTSQ